MKATAKNIAKYVNDKLDKYDLNNISVCFGKLNKHTLYALQNNYGFKEVRREFSGYVYFRR
jgi:hypothetical protein